MISDSQQNISDYEYCRPSQEQADRQEPQLDGGVLGQGAAEDGFGGCARDMRGTSMSTPLIAGAAALVRQYFLSGFYPGGSSAPANQYAPSGAAVKAVLLGGAAGMDGFESDTGLPLAPPPSFRQGFGRLNLARSLPMQVTGGLLCRTTIIL